MFTDQVQIDVTAGKGGNGIIAWRREKFIPKGGPSGGNGGNGGSVYIQADAQLISLEWYRLKHEFSAENGRQGGSNDQHGRNGKDLTLKVPCGTLIKDRDTGEILCDLTVDKQKWQACKGGRGGRGNTSFKSPTHQAPHHCTPGQPGEELHLDLELKLIADIGLVGFPNAGKSTLISNLAKVKVKIAPYPFTTLSPNIGYIERDNYTRLFIADIPGIIKDAHLHRGLGLEFLRHIERTQLLIFVLDASGIDGRNPTEDYQVLRSEIEQYNPEMLSRPFYVVLNKIDVDESMENIEHFHQTISIEPSRLFEVSAMTGEGMDHLLNTLKKT